MKKKVLLAQLAMVSLFAGVSGVAMAADTPILHETSDKVTDDVTKSFDLSEATYRYGLRAAEKSDATDAITVSYTGQTISLATTVKPASTLGVPYVFQTVSVFGGNQGTTLTLGGDDTDSVNISMDVAAPYSYVNDKSQTVSGNCDTYTVYATGAKGTLNIYGDSVTINSKSTGGAYAVVAGGGATINIGKTGTVAIDANGGENGALGILASGSNVNINADTLTITSNASGNARAVEADDGSTVNIGKADSKTGNVTINAKGGTDGAMGIFALQSRVVIDADTLTVNSTATDGYTFGIHVQNNNENGTVDENTASVVINANQTTVTSDNAGISAFSLGQMTINGSLTVNAPNAIDVRGNSTTKINTEENGTVVLNGDIVYETPGAQHNSGTALEATVEVHLVGEGSSWTGQIYQDYSSDATPSGGIASGGTIYLKDGAQWNAVDKVTEKTATDTDKETIKVAALSSLIMDNGVINLEAANFKETSKGVQIESITGAGGTINTDSTENSISVTKSVADTTELTVSGTGEMADAYNAADDTGKETLANNLAGVVKSTASDATGAQKKSVAKKVAMKQGVIAGAVTMDVDSSTGKVKTSTATQSENTYNRSVSNISNIALMTWRQENNDMNKRLGELRASKGEYGVWARMARGESEYGGNGLKNQYNYYQLGFDKKLSGGWTAGGALTYTDGESSFYGGSGTNEHTGFAVYGSKLNDDGSFLDLIAKYAYMKQDFDMTGGVGNGDFHTNGYSLSAEYGKRFALKKAFWLEPQAELTYGHVSSADYTTSAGASVHQDSMDSFVGRLGFSLGRDVEKGNVYVRASYLYDFDGDAGVYMEAAGAGSARYDADLGGGWWEVGLGTNLTVGDDTHVYFDVEKTYGGTVATPWQWNAGIRFGF